MKPLRDCRLYTFVDTAYLRGRDPVEVARQLCAGGSDLIQLRAKHSTADEVRRLAEALLAVTEPAGVGLVINDHPRVALQAGAPACHLGQEDFFEAGYTQASQVTGCPPEMKLGLSTHAPEQAERALRAGPDYIAIGPVFATPTKPGRPPATLDYVRWAAAHVKIPWFAIGGLTLDRLDDVLAAGARRVCVVSAILNASDIARACQNWRERLASAPL
ncbi:MAG TPA: thiamine phosphate synthase [Methylomirabilota bacterium]|nr:thiamine phosphate synthase [Methylomirabilota bacterium]